MYFDTTLGLDCLTIVLRTATILSILEGLSDFFFEPTELITLSEDILRTLLFLLTVLFFLLEVLGFLCRVPAAEFESDFDLLLNTLDLPLVDLIPSVFPMPLCPG
jgi:hypothetical protein